MITINDIEITEEHLKNEKYNFQPELTERLDLISSDFDQEIVNQIVLWKVNRYAEIDNETLSLINTIDRNDSNINESLTTNILEKLLLTKGVKLAMASTILRFKNPKIYQIIDQRVYRLIYGKNIPTYFSNIEKQVSLYLEYLKQLKIICKEKNINFEQSDRILYQLDKNENSTIKLK